MERRDPPQASWIASAQLERAEGGAAALTVIERLDPVARRDLLGRGERLAAASLSLAQTFAIAAARAIERLDPETFARWADRGEGLAGDLGNRDAATAYFRLDPLALSSTSERTVEQWLALARRLTETSRRLGVLFLESSGPVLPTLGEDAAERLAAYVAAATSLATAGWRGEFLAAAFLGGGGAALTSLDAAELADYVALGLAVQVGRDLDQGFLQRLPTGFVDLEPGERRSVLALGRRAAAAAPRPAATLFAELPRALASLAPELRRPLLDGFRAAAASSAEILRLLPLLPAIVRALPDSFRVAVLERLAVTAERFPSCLVAALRSLPRAAEVGGREAIEAWIERGEKVAEESLGAGHAFFALESRTGLVALREGSAAARFLDVEGVLRSYARLLAEAPIRLREATGASLRPFLDVESLDAESFALPSTVAVFDSWEENFSLYKLMTANAVGRRLFGTYELDLADVRERLPPPLAEAFAEHVPGRTLAELLEALANDPLVAVFGACEGARIDRRLRSMYRGFAAELGAIGRHFFRLAARDPRPPTAELLVYLIGAGIPARDLAKLETGLDVDLLEMIAAILLSPAATAADALAAAILLRERLGESLTVAGFGPQLNYEELFFEQMIEAGAERAAMEALAEDAADEASAREIVDVPPEAVEESDEEESGGVPLSAEELRRLLEQGALLKVGKGRRVADSAGIFATGLDLAAGAAEETDDFSPDEQTAVAEAKRRVPPGERRVYEYDEWDFEIRDYRPHWCRLEEVTLGGDAGEFFQQALSRHADLLPEVRRQFQRIRPERYRRIRGLEDGEDFDLNAVVEAHVDRRARRTPSSRLYVARRREERDVATLFLVDMSASTDEALAAEKKAARGGRPRRIIDVTKEALVVMAEALEEIGDQYAVYGFSGEGRKNVEFYRVKRFSEGLGASVRGRIGGIEPKRSTRMGTALRHAILKMKNVASRSKHVLLLSDGFPQDFDYGTDRRSNAYGIHDTMMALQECQAAGITPFCITVDKTGHDYLRQMCETSRYLVIEDVEALPIELPKIYERWVQG